MSQASPSYTLSQPRVAFALSLIALLTVGWNATRYVVTTEHTVAAHSEYIKEDKIQKQEIAEEIKQLNLSVMRLVTIVEGKQSAFSYQK